MALNAHSDGTGLARIGYGAAEAFPDAGADVIIVSSSADNVKNAVRALNSPNVSGVEGNVRDESAFVETLRSLAPVDHIVFSALDRTVYGSLVDLEEAKYLFGVKFWGSVVVGKGVCTICQQSAKAMIADSL
jgi:NAD(P)-dependent dehydrogenase (short-subunit alcohol dehydrogenase family)